MIFVFVSILVFAATTALVAALVQRRREKEFEGVKQRVGKSEKSGPAPVMAERDTRMSTIPLLDNLLRALGLVIDLELDAAPPAAPGAAPGRLRAFPPRSAIGHWRVEVVDDAPQLRTEGRHFVRLHSGHGELVLLEHDRQRPLIHPPAFRREGPHPGLDQR